MQYDEGAVVDVLGMVAYVGAYAGVDFQLGPTATRFRCRTRGEATRQEWL
jgi:hypothetical protein